MAEANKALYRNGWFVLRRVYTDGSRNLKQGVEAGSGGGRWESGAGHASLISLVSRLSNKGWALAVCSKHAVRSQEWTASGSAAASARRALLLLLLLRVHLHHPAPDVARLPPLAAAAEAQPQRGHRALPPAQQGGGRSMSGSHARQQGATCAYSTARRC